MVKEDKYFSFLNRKRLILIGLVAMLIICVLVSLSVGSSGLSLKEILETLLGKGTSQANSIIWKIRMPRILTGLLVGISLSLSGCVMQNVLRNPLASSSTLGVSQGASFGAAFAIIYLNSGTQVNASTASAISISNPYMVTLCAFIGGFLTTLIILFLTRVTKVSPSTVVLSGVALSSLFTGGTTITQYFADDVKVASVVYWTFGDLGRGGLKEIGIIFTVTFLGFIFFIYNRWNYNAMEGGVNTAKSLGVNVDALTIISMGLASLLASVSTAFVGCISFIGLIAPHMARGLVGNDYRFLIPASAIMGGIILVLAELVSRTIVSPSILPIGALTSFLGGPIFLYMLFKRGSLK